MTRASFARALDRAYDYSAFAPPPTVGPARRIAVIGAGMAGLTAAYELGRRGHRVSVYEAGTRLGGRVHTLHFGDRLHGELGAMRIAAHHRCVLHYVRAFGLATRRFVHHNPRAYYHLRGRRVRIGHPQALWGDGHGHADPAALESEAVEALLENLGQEAIELLLRGERPQSMCHLEQVTYWEFVARALQPAVAELMGAASGAAHYNRVACLAGLIDWLNWSGSKFFELCGGMDALTRAFAARLPEPVQLGSALRGCHLREHGVTLELGPDGRQKRFDFVVCAAPATAVRHVRFSPELPTAQAQALAGLRYSPAAKSLVLAPRVWERIDGIAGGASVTDLPIHQCWYPSDNARIDSRGVPTVANPERAQTEGVLTAGYRWERHAEVFAGLALSERDAATLVPLGLVHPDLPRQVEDCAHKSWPEAYAFFGPGDSGRYRDPLRWAYPRSRPRVFFAGEHLSPCHASVQGAVQSALEAVTALELVSSAQPETRPRNPERRNESHVEDT